jgi:hypothetical protein
MGRRRTIGETRSAGAGRRCPHPPRDRQYHLTNDTTSVRCRRCGQTFLNLSPPRPRDKPWRPHP